MSLPFLHTASGAYDLPAILTRAWARARNAVTIAAKLGDRTTARACFAAALRETWDEARSARAIAVFRAQQDAAFAAAEASGTAEIINLESLRAAADGIDNTARFLVERGAIEARLGVQRAA